MDIQLSRATLILFDRFMLGPSYGEIFLQVRTKQVSYLTNAEENELKLLKTTTIREFLAMKNFWSQKAKAASLLGIGEEREW